MKSSSVIAAGLRPAHACAGAQKPGGQIVRPVRRRPQAERLALRFIRGEGEEKDGQPRAAQVDRALHILPFVQLRGLLTQWGFAIQSTHAPYLNDDEMVILAWLAKAQRVSSHGEDYHSDLSLTRALFRCAGILTGLGIGLPPMTMLSGIVGDRRDALAVQQR